ncbi:MAG TPA: YceI family protein [Caulobacteraceae bacterium]|jgi:polyisoprenoid-binding protein YceI
MRRSSLLMIPLALGAVLGATVAQAQSTCPTGLPPGVYCGSPDVAGAPAGTYTVDPSHAAIVAKVSHIGYSYSVFRFGKVTGSLDWNPAAPGSTKLTASVETASIGTPVPGFPAELSGPQYLNSTKFPQASFVSTAFHRLDATHGKVDGQFTLLGVTRPMTFDVTLIGAGKGFGAPRMGVEATSSLDPKAFGMPPFFVAPIQLVIDAEFQKAP